MSGGAPALSLAVGRVRADLPPDGKNKAAQIYEWIKWRIVGRLGALSRPSGLATVRRSPFGIRRSPAARRGAAQRGASLAPSRLMSGPAPIGLESGAQFAANLQRKS